jgi:proline dehydrogenase
MNPVRTGLLAASRNGRVRRLVETAPVSRDVVGRFVAGSALEDAVRVTGELVADGLCVTLDHLGEYTTEPGHAEATAKAYLQLIGRLGDAGLAAGRDGGPARAEVSVKLSALGQGLDERLAVEHARTICAAAREAGTTVTLDMEDHTTVGSTLAILRRLRGEFGFVGAVLQSYLRRTEQDCTTLSTAGTRVRLCKGAYDAPEEVAFTRRQDIDRSYVRCAAVLMRGSGYPMIATHDPRLIEIAGRLAADAGRATGSYEYQMLYGIRPLEQRRLAAAGHTVRVYVPYGSDWYGYLMRRLAERPANLGFFLRSLVSRH